MYYVYPVWDRLVTVYESEFLDDIEVWFNVHDKGRTRYDVLFVSLDD